MFIEQRMDKAEMAMDAIRREIERISKGYTGLEKRQAEHEQKVEEAVRKVAASSGFSPEQIANLLVEIARNIYPSIHPTAPKGSARDDGEPTDKPGAIAQAVEVSQETVGTAQNAEASPPPLSDEAADDAAEGGDRPPEVVASSEEAPASSPADAPEPVVRCVVNGRSITGPHADIFVSLQSAKIIQRLLSGPAMIRDLNSASNEPQERMTRLRMANMRSLLSDAGLEIKVTGRGAGEIFRLVEKGR